ncbi:hypothetical protein BDL97_15G035800 [Sphagnum fallax]|nr:hypothetical protein BDL97_15G035800 [Sphagnum fallax]
MTKAKSAKKVLDSFLVKGTDKSVRVGDTVLMRAEDSEKPPYVAKIEKIEADSRNNIKLRVCWYYRPEESKCGRRPFHGARELFLSDHYDIQSADTIEGTCTVHTFRNYIKLETVRAEDFFCRFEYQAATGDFTPDRVAVFHGHCVNLSTEQVITTEKYMCTGCSNTPENNRNKGIAPDT